MYRLIRIDDSTSANERDLNHLVAQGYILRHIVPGHPGQWDRAGEFITGSDSPAFFVLEKSDDPIDAILTAIKALDDMELAILIDALPDDVIDPICQCCDPVIDDSEFDDPTDEQVTDAINQKTAHELGYDAPGYGYTQ